MPDFSFYQALNAAPHYDVRRRDSMANLAIAKQMRDDAVDQMKEKMAAMSAISASLNEATDAEQNFLGPDAERLKEKEMQIRKKNILGPLSEHNNDPVMFRMMGGQAAQDKYHRDLVGSDEFRNGIDNAKNYKLGVDATMKGEMIDPVEVEFQGGTKQTVPWHDAVELFNQKAIKKLPFTSSVPLAELDPMKFLAHEVPDADLKHKGYVGEDYVADLIQAENPRYTRKQALAQAKLFDNPDVAGATHFIWGRRLPHTSGGSGVAWQNMMNKMTSVKSITDNLHRALFDPSMKGDYDPSLNAYQVNGQPLDLTKLKHGTGKTAANADGLFVRNDPTNPANSRFIVSYDDGSQDELTFDDMAQRVLGSSNVNISDYTLLNQFINQDGTAVYNPSKYAGTVVGQIPFMGSVGGEPASAPPDFIANDPKLLKAWNATHSGSQRKDFQYGNPVPSSQLETIPGW